MYFITVNFLGYNHSIKKGIPRIYVINVENFCSASLKIIITVMILC